jgi:hypothetical protein
VPLDPLIVQLATDRRWLVRHSAIGALGNADGEVEDVLLRLARTSKDPHDLVYINAALGRVGGQRSLEYLMHAAGHSKEDVATSALAALTKVGTVAQEACFLVALADRRWSVKWYAMIAIEVHGDRASVDPVLTRAKRILSRKRGVPQAPRSELGAALAFLWRHRTQDANVASFFDDFLPGRRNKLTEEERALLQQAGTGTTHTPALTHHT